MIQKINPDKMRLKDILEFIDEIEDFARTDRNDKKTMKAIAHNLVLIGEAARNVTPALKAAHPYIPWRDVADTRNLIVHDYARVDMIILWQIVDSKLSALRAQIESILKTLP